MIIYRYLTKEVIIALAGLTTVLLLIFLSNQFVHYLTRAASGQMPGLIVFQLMLLEIPNLIGLLLPLGLFMALLLAYGRLYAENEMMVLQACGFSQSQLLRVTLLITALVMVVVSVIVLWVSPIVSRDRDHLLTGGGVSAFIETLVPGRFYSLSGGKKIFYAEGISKRSNFASDLFMAEHIPAQGDNPEQWRIVTSVAGQLKQNTSLGEDFLLLKQGKEYIGNPGDLDFQVIEFEQYQARLPQATPRIRKWESALPTKKLFPINNQDLKKAAELQWRLSIPLMTLVLALLAVPLSRVNPRQGKYAKILPSIVIYFIYANMLFVGRDWIVDAVVPVWLGMWWLHLSMLAFAGILWLMPSLQLYFYRRKHDAVT